MIKRSLLLIVVLVSLLPSIGLAQDRQVTGKVTDETGKPLSDVNVQVKGTTNATATTPEGLFSINVPSGRTSLVFSSIGYEAQQVSVNNRNEIDVSMKLSVNDLSDVVVIGYGTQKRKNVTGAVSSFDARKLEERPILRVDQALVGQLAGVRVKQTTGTPGKGFSIQIRVQVPSAGAMNPYT